MSASLKEEIELTQGSITTFYSYKGGVGRSMALANVAALLAKWGKKVLVIDWDLEAPGIERFFQRWLHGDRRNTDGLLELIHSTTTTTRLDWNSCLLSASLPGCKPISILHAGRDNTGYGDRLRAINWDVLFEKHRLGHVLDELREEWLREFDFVLIDSRTGITDIGGVCSIFLPDVLVTLFTATEQSLSGVRDVMATAREKHAALPVDRRRLMIVPVPARDESGSEYKLAAEWRARFARELNDFFLDWMPKGETPERILNHLKIPYFAYWSFGEKLPAIEEDPDNPKTLAFSYQLIARLLLGKLDWEEVLKGTQASEANAAQNLAVQEKSAEAARIRAQAQQAEAQREAAREEQELAELEKRREQFFNFRLEPAIADLRSGAWQAIACFVVAFGASIAILWRDNLLFPSVQRASVSYWEIFVLIAVGMLAASVGGLFSYRNLRGARIISQLDRERALYEARAGEYSAVLLRPTQAFTRFAERCEDLIGRRTPGAGAEAEKSWVETVNRAFEQVSAPAPAEKVLPTDSPIDRSEVLKPLKSHRLRNPASPVGPAPSSSPDNLTDLVPGDVFISYRRSPITDQWLKEFLPLFHAWLNEYMGRVPNVFVNNESPKSGDGLPGAVEQQVKHARCVMPILSRAYFTSAFTALEWKTALSTGADILPISLTPLTMEELPAEARRMSIMDFSQYAFVGEGFSKTEGYVEFQSLVRELARRVADVLERNPEIAAAVAVRGEDLNA